MSLPADDGVKRFATKRSRHARRTAWRGRSAVRTRRDGRPATQLLAADAADAASGGIDRKRSTRLLARLSTSAFQKPESS